MIVVTGAAGFIGSCLVKGLNQIGITDILAVDDLTDGKKFINLSDCEIADYMDYEDFLKAIQAEQFKETFAAIFHQGACSTTTEWNGRFMMKVNYEYSKILLHYCLELNIPFIYASSAAVYGVNTAFSEQLVNEQPINVYGYSKWQFDQYVRRLWPKIEKQCAQVVGLRYFNVYGPNEQHKGSMASVAFHLMNQVEDTGVVKLFEGCDGYADGEQLRDFVFVDDAVKVNLWFYQHRDKSGIFNVGTGVARPFNAIAKTILKLYGAGRLEYVPFPDKLKGSYQSFTQADISKLRAAGFDAPFTSLEAGVTQYFKQRFAPRKISQPAVTELLAS